MFRVTAKSITRCIESFNNALVKAPTPSVAIGVFVVIGFCFYTVSVLPPPGFGSLLVYVGLAIVVCLIALAALFVVAKGNRAS